MTIYPKFLDYQLTSIHKSIEQCLSMLIIEPNEIPEWVTEGIIYLLLKTGETDDSKNYSPVTCLSTTYKLITSF